MLYVNGRVIKSLASFSKLIKQWSHMSDTVLGASVSDPAALAQMIPFLKGFETPTLIVRLYRLSQTDDRIKRFCDGLKESEFDWSRFEDWKAYRSSNKTDSSSIQYYKLKFGETWEHHKARLNSQRSNPNDVNYVMNKYNMTEQEATAKINDMKKRSTPSIERDGEEAFRRICKVHKNYIEYWLKRHEPDEAHRLFQEYKRNANKRTTDFWVNRGYSEEDAKMEVSKFQRTTSGLHAEYYLERGYTDSEIKEIFDEISTRKDSASLKFLESKNPNVDKDSLMLMHKDHNNHKSSIFRETGMRLEDHPDFEPFTQYKAAVMRITRMNLKHVGECPGTRGRYKANYHLDHNYSIKQGFVDNIPVEIIGSPANLRWMVAQENSSKRADCHMTREQLIEKYKEFTNENNKN